MAGILVYALHDDEGNFNKNSLGALSEASKLAGELGTEAAAVSLVPKPQPSSSETSLMKALPDSATTASPRSTARRT